MTDRLHIDVTNITVRPGRVKEFKLDVDGHDVAIPVEEVLFANYQNQFYRKSPSPAQQNKFNTLRSLMRAAYKQGLKVGKTDGHV